MPRRSLVLAAVAVAGIAYMRCRGAHAPSSAPDSNAGATMPNGSADSLDDLAATLRRARIAYAHIARGELRLEGEAIDEHKRPIAGATITLDGERTTTTDADGAFAFDNLAAGDYQLVGERDAAYGEDAVTLGETSDPEELVLRLGPTVVVHVADRAGAPVVGAKVSANRHLDAFTDGAGVVRLRGMDIGTDSVDVIAAGFASLHLSLEVGDEPERTIERHVTLKPSALIGGVVLDETGAPVADASVSIDTPHNGWSDRVDSDARGRWQVAGFGAGKIIVSASSDTHIAAHEVIAQLDGLQPKLDLVVRIERGATIGGVVVDTSGKPVKDARVVAGMGHASTDEQGHFLVVGLEPGPTTVRVDADRFGAPLQQIELGRTTHPELRFVVTESGIAGVVRDPHGVPVANAHIAARGTTDAYTTSDETGHFDFGGLPPGNYSVGATRDGDSGDAEQVAQVRSGERGIVLVVSEVGSITGRVVMRGASVAYFGVLVSADPDPSYDSPEPVRSSDGRFVHEGVRPGTWNVVVVGPTFQRKVIHGVTLTSAQLELGDIEVEPGRTVHGRVVDSGGVPVAGADVVVMTSASTNEVSLRGALSGARGAHTDAHGAFEIEGVPDEPTELEIRASEPEHGMALPRSLSVTELDSDLELVLAEMGSVTGTVANTQSTSMYRVHVASLSDDRTLGVRVDHGEFAVDEVPPGDYIVSLAADVVTSPIVVHVAAGAATAVAFALPTAPVALEIDMPSSSCTDVIVTSADLGNVNIGGMRYAHLAACIDDHHAEVPAIAPGRYQLCTASCTAIEVAPSPAVQTVTLE